MKDGFANMLVVSRGTVFVTTISYYFGALDHNFFFVILGVPDHNQSRMDCYTEYI